MLYVCVTIVELYATRRSEPKVWAAKKNLAEEVARSQNTTLVTITVTVKITILTNTKESINT